jgi:hypothetical protein
MRRRSRLYGRLMAERAARRRQGADRAADRLPAEDGGTPITPVLVRRPQVMDILGGRLPHSGWS